MRMVMKYEDDDLDMMVDGYDAFVVMDSLLVDDNIITISSICMLVSTS